MGREAAMHVTEPFWVRNPRRGAGAPNRVTAKPPCASSIAIAEPACCQTKWIECNSCTTR